MAGNAGAKQRFMDQFVLGDPQEEANYSRATLRRNAESPAAPAYLGSPREGRGELEVEPHYSNAHELDEIITDEGAPQEELERIRSAGVKLTVVGK